MVEVSIHPAIRGRLTPSALLQSEGSIELVGLDEATFQNDSCIFHIATNGFCFGLGFLKGQLVFQRNEHVLSIPSDFIKKINGNDAVIASWTMEKMIFLLGHIGFQGPSISRYINISCCPAPIGLFDWARKNCLLPKQEYESENELVERIHSSLQAVQEKIECMPSVDIFWDIEYEGNKIIRRTPKKEKDLHSIIQALLSDQMYLSSIEVVCEYPTGHGNVDFVFIGYVKNLGPIKMCAKFKCAHSKDIYNGIRYQLPKYMISQKTKHGTYCVLNFRCEWFPEPKISSTEFSNKLGHAAKLAGLPRENLIKVHKFNIGKKQQASADAN